ncbi:hypothetical protein PHLGIDRAFT_115531 [Phlebiopsis gigantea 11061_1 CR5-6]|uniref:tRNA (guanine(9)-N1)-methyltransferase n=1 Tax=Phlebiopsis gigantea (strain 11061_1 CR5-6) TaxID=745531 RepID=A0A0C3NYB2_PHLG1|nr:hypothetical protein PHLGIDRAFT_115531 [Phlebiopsis gigantea 11061_1 CR5-6]
MTSDPQVQAEQSTPSSAYPIVKEFAPQQPLSKNAQKRLAKAARIAEQKKERRAFEKEKKKEKKRELAAKRAAGELDEGDQEPPKKKARTEGPRTPFEARIVIDLGFDDMMTENEVKSLTSQLAYTYNAHKKASNPFSSLLFTSLNGRTFTRLESLSDAAYKRWKDTEWWHEGYERLWEGKPSEAVSETANKSEVGEEDNVETKLAKTPQTAAQDSVVYLTADSKDELSELKAGETYIIGGICDHNRYKNLCLNKAEASGIRSARLPIGSHLAELKTRKVLTVNQTFEILLRWVETKNWKAALEEVIPKRKFNEKGRAAKKGGADERSERASEGQADRAVEGVVVVDVAELEDEDADAEGEDDIDGDAEWDESHETETLVEVTQGADSTNGTGLTLSLENPGPEVPS